MNTLSPEFSSQSATERLMYDALRKQQSLGGGEDAAPASTPK